MPFLKFKPYNNFMFSSCCSEPIGCTCEFCYVHHPNSAAAQIALRVHLEQQKELEENRDVQEVQSATEKVSDVTEESTQDQQEQNLAFSDPVDQIKLIVGQKLSDKTYMVSKTTTQDDLTNFLSRPIRIFSKVWDVNESPDYVNSFNPWLLFLSDTKVVNKLETFKLLQGTLNLKFIVNGTPFHYGRMFVGVLPTYYDNNNILIDPVTTTATTNMYDGNTLTLKSINPMACFYSQRPHIFIDPATNQPQAIEWPFFVPGNYIDITDLKTINRMGSIEMWELSKLKHANGASDAVEIAVFAWMTNVTFAGLTATSPATAQSASEPKATKKKKKSSKPPVMDGPEKPGPGEYAKDGLISGPASTLKEFADYFTEIPYIGKFAKATSIASGAVSQIAILFGFSRPPVLSDTVFVRPQNIGNMANYHGADPIQKLSLDPKQELTIDPGTVGLTAEDQMSFGYIAKKEAWIDNFQWNATTTQNTGLLYSVLVHPMVKPSFLVSGEAVTCQTPLSMVALPFKYWSGSLKFRFQVIASQFHRGRLLFVYEPNVATVGTVADTNDRFSHVVDISEEKDFTFEINWTQQDAYRSTGIDYLTSNVSIEGPGGSLADPDAVAYANGRLNVYVVNQLATPTDGANVEINVFISAGDSFEVKAPSYNLTNFAYSREDVPVGPPDLAQSGSERIEAGATVTQQENFPEQDTMYVLNGTPTCMTSEQSDVYFGEAIVSARSLMKRYCFHRVLCTEENEVVGIFNNDWTINNVPNGPGQTYGSSPASPISQSSVGNYNICALTYIRYFMSAYAGFRGSIRWKITFFNEDGDIMSVKVTRSEGNSTNEESATRLCFGAATSVYDAQQRFLEQDTNLHALTGTMCTAGNVNPTLEYEVPYYNNYRYSDCSAPYAGDSDAAAEWIQCRHQVSYTSRHEANNNFSWIELYCATGEDFSLFFFIGAPPLLFSDTLTVTPG